MADALELSPELGRRLRTLVLRLRAYVVIEGVAWLVGAWAAAFALLATLDYMIRLSRGVRAMLLLPLLVGLGALAWRRLWPALRLGLRVPDAAHLLERHKPQWASLLISAVRFAGGQLGAAEFHSRELASEVVRQANRVLLEQWPRHVLRHRRAIGSVAVIGTVAGCLSIWAIVCDSSLGLALSRIMWASSRPWPQRTHIHVNIEGRRLAAAVGDDVEITARVSGVMPDDAQIVFETASGKQGRMSMTRVGENGLRFTFASLSEPLTFHLEGGDDRTDDYDVILSERPRIKGFSIRVEPPPYTRLPPQVVSNDQHTIRALPGSRIILEFTTSLPVPSAAATLGETRELAVDPTPEGWRASFHLEGHTVCNVTVTNAEGLSNRRPERFVFHTLRDDPPAARLSLPGAGELITAEAVLNVELHCTDDYGLGDVRIDATVAAAPPRTVALPVSGFEPWGKEFQTELEWPVREASVAPGDILMLCAIVSDQNDVSGPGVVTPSPLTLRVVTREELSADIARREQEYRRQFQRLVDQQEDIRRQLLTVADDAPRLATAAALSERLSPLERRQRNLASAVAQVARQFQRLVDETRINRLDSGLLRSDPRSDIAGALDVLSRADLIDAAEAVRRWSREGSSAATMVDPRQAEVLRKMHDILARMRESAGYHEAVTMLEEIIRLQKELNEQTRKKAQDQAESLFDD